MERITILSIRLVFRFYVGCSVRIASVYGCVRKHGRGIGPTLFYFLVIYKRYTGCLTKPLFATNGAHNTNEIIL